MKAVILVGHGSRVKDSEKDMVLVAAELRNILRHTVVETSYLSLTPPPFEDAVEKCLEAGASKISVIPYMLSQGAHVLKDIPEMIRLESEKHPGLNFVYGDYLGFDDGMVECVRRRIVATQVEKGDSQLAELIANQRLAVLGTSDAITHFAYTSLVGYLPLEQMKQFVFATLRESQKFKNIIANPHVSLLIDNRNHGAGVFYSAEAVTVIGTAKEVSTETKEVFLNRFKEHHPQLEEFVNHPDCVLVTVDVEKIIHVDNLLNVTEFVPE